VPSPDDLGLVWFRRDLRLDDNPAWADATSTCGAVMALYVLDARLVGPAGPHRRRQLFASLHALDRDLAERGGGRLLVRNGDPAELVADTVERWGVGRVWWNADVTPFAGRRDAEVAARIGVPSGTFFGSLVHAPGDVLTAKGSISRVFTPFFRTWQRTGWRSWPHPGRAEVVAVPADGLPALDGQPPLPAGETEARHRLERFVGRVDRYGDERDRPDLDTTSQLSVDLKYGTISPRTIVERIGTHSPGRLAFVRQLAWRDWYAHLLANDPRLPDVAMKPRYEGIRWRDDPTEIAAWKNGATGYPLVDAGMRQLRTTGWMHNRVRLVCASFLVKNLLVDWRKGERYFRHLLVDADVAQNAGNWQWVAGTGPDASPYNRIFNPVTQSRRFDPSGAYIRRWVQELRSLDDHDVHAPWEAHPESLAAAGVALGEDYPEPLVDLRSTRARALAAYAAAGSGPQSGS
jgi:deoxyribodipyrimidine photo-lyase